MSPDRSFLSTTAFPHHGLGKVARFVLSQIEIATRKASRASPSMYLDPRCPAIDHCTGGLGWHFYSASDSPGSEITED